MISIKVNESSAQKVIKAFKASIDASQNFAPLWLELIGPEHDQRQWTLRGSVSNAFARKKSPNNDGQPWAKLAKSTLEQKKKNYPGQPSLVASGTLFNSLTSTNRFSVQQLQPKKMVFGTSVPYAQFLQRGTSRMPSRPFLGWNDKQKKAIKSVVTNYMKEVMSGSPRDPRAIARDASAKRGDS